MVNEPIKILDKIAQRLESMLATQLNHCGLMFPLLIPIKNVFNDEIFKRCTKSNNRVSRYAQTNDSEDFAECMKAYITDHDLFKHNFPNRAAFIRNMAQSLSSRLPKYP